MVATAIPGSVGRSAAVVAPGMMVMAIILFMGRVSGAHLNPAVTIAFWLRRDFPGRRVPGYVVTQLVGASLAAWFLRAARDVSARYGSTYPAPRWSTVDAGTASGAQQVGLFGAIGVGSYVALAGLWASPISGASMNPARTFGPDLVSAHFAGYWVHVVGPLAGAVLAVGIAYVLRGPGGGHYGSTAAQGTLTAHLGHGEPR